MRTSIARAISVAALAAFPLTASASVPDPVKTDAGLLTVDALPSGVQVYRGIPFGAPPVGNL